MKQRIVEKYPYAGALIRSNVRTAGPTIRGIPMGTTPKVSLGKVLVLSEKIKSTMAKIKRRIPPATLKSEIVIPSNLKIERPAKRKPNPARKAVRVDCRITFLRSVSAISEVRVTKIGRIPSGSKATKKGIKGRNILKDKNELIKFSTPDIDSLSPYAHSIKNFSVPRSLHWRGNSESHLNTLKWKAEKLRPSISQKILKNSTPRRK